MFSYFHYLADSYLDVGGGPLADPGRAAQDVVEQEQVVVERGVREEHGGRGVDPAAEVRHQPVVPQVLAEEPEQHAEGQLDLLGAGVDRGVGLRGDVVTGVPEKSAKMH